MIKINNVKELDNVLSEWILKDNLSEEQTIEIPLYVIKQFQAKCYTEQHSDTLKQIKAEIEHRIKINEGTNSNGN